MNTSESIKELSTALAKAQAVMAGAKRDATNPHFKSRYADLASVWEACREALTKNGIAVVQMTAQSERDEVVVVTRLCHASGEWMEGVLNVPVTKADAQGFGSALTYARRYSLAAAVGVAPEDDDGNAAAAAKPKQAFERKHTPMAEFEDQFAKLGVDQQQWYRDEAEEIMACFKRAGDLHAHIEDRRYSDEDKLYLWLLLPSDCRSAVKKAQAAARSLAEQA